MDSFFLFLQKNSTVTQQLYRTISSKRYSRFNAVTLPAPETITTNLSQIIQDRASIRDFSEDGITLQQLSTFLHWSAGYTGGFNEIGPRRAFASGGAKYPIEIYIYIQRCDTLRGLYHYQPDGHTLVELPFQLSELQKRIILNEPYAAASDALLLFSFRKNVSFGKYANLAYKLGLIEVGSVLQNMYLVLSGLGLGGCPVGIGSAEGRRLEEILRLEREETVICRLAIGTPAKSN